LSDSTQPDGKSPDSAGEGTVAVHHANQLRSAKFKSMMRKKSTWAWLVGLSVVGGGILAAFAGPGIGLIGFLIIFAVILLVVFGIADRQAEDAFYDFYCESHGLTRSMTPDIGELTPLLRKGDKTSVDEVFTGELAENIHGDLVLYTYTEVHRDSDGDETETDYPFTLIHVEMPEIIPHMTDLRVERASFKFLDGIEDKFLGDFERVTLESEAFSKRFEVFVRKDQDAIWTRRLFSPSFIVWLTENPPDSFSFELENGHLVAFVSKHMDDTASLEKVTDVGTKVAARLLEEVAQTSPRTGPEAGQ